MPSPVEHGACCMVVGADLLLVLRLASQDSGTQQKRPNLWQHARLTATLLPQSDASGQASISSRASAEAKGTALSRLILGPCVA